MSDEASIYPPDVQVATRVIARWLRARSSKNLHMTISRLGLVDLHFETLAEVYERGKDDGLGLRPGDLHTDPQKVCPF